MTHFKTDEFVAHVRLGGFKSAFQELLMPLFQLRDVRDAFREAIDTDVQHRSGGFMGDARTLDFWCDAFPVGEPYSWSVADLRSKDLGNNCADIVVVLTLWANATDSSNMRADHVKMEFQITETYALDCTKTPAQYYKSRMITSMDKLKFYGASR